MRKINGNEYNAWGYVKVWSAIIEDTSKDVNLLAIVEGYPLLETPSLLERLSRFIKRMVRK